MILFGHWKYALEKAGRDPSAIYLRQPFSRSKGSTLEDLIAAIQSIPKNERNSRAVQVHSERRKYYSLAQRIFRHDSWESALRAANLDPDETRKKTRLCSPDEILQYIHYRKKAGLSLAPKDILKSSKGRRCYKAANKPIWRDSWMSIYVGWCGAVEEAGYDVDEEGIAIMYSSAKPRLPAAI